MTTAMKRTKIDTHLCSVFGQTDLALTGPALPDGAAVHYLASHNEGVLQENGVRIHRRTGEKARIAFEHTASAHKERVESANRKRRGLRMGRKDIKLKTE